MRWYLTVAAVCEYQRIAGYPVERDGQWFDRAEQELAAIAEQARLVEDADMSPGRELYRVRAVIRGIRRRLELTVSIDPRPEGPLPQLVRVRDKDGRADR